MEDVRTWRAEAVRLIEADYNRSADTHLVPIALPRHAGITLYLKDESSHPTGSLKHRLARSLFLYALCNGWIGPNTCVIEASSGSTAVSEAYFARMLGLRFIAVVPATTAAPKIDAIRFHGGEIHAVDDPRTVYAVAQRLAAETGGHYLDQFTHAERATDWRGNNNIAESISPRWRGRNIRSRHGSSVVQGPAGPRRRSVVICAISGMRPGYVSPIPSILFSTGTMPILLSRPCPRSARAVSKALAVRGSNQASYQPSSTA